MEEEFLDLARQIDENEDAINDALEQDDFETANKLVLVKESLFKRISELAPHMLDQENVQDYLSSLYQATYEQLEILKEQHEDMRLELMHLKKGNKGHRQYQTVRGYVGGKKR